MSLLTRRHFLRRSAAMGLGLAGLKSLGACGSAEIYGHLVPDPKGILDLPGGFAYQILSRMGDKMDDGLLVPGAHDGMAAFPGPDGMTILVRNHELKADGTQMGAFGSGNKLLKNVDRAMLYDAGRGERPGLGGTTTILYDTRERKLVRHWASLAGTWRNCAGGPTPWGSWVTCEETVQRAKGVVEKDHGYNFEVPASASIGLTPAVPLKAMGRFNHEAIAVDPKSGCVYQTEDRGMDRGTGVPLKPVKDPTSGDLDPGELPGAVLCGSLIYRYVPDAPGQLARGGRLQALKIRDKAGCDTSNRRKDRIAVGRSLDVEWIDLEEIDSPKDDLRHRGFARGAAVFSRGEGMWHGNDAVYFASTDGGTKRKGQIWRYMPSPDEGKPEENKRPGRLELFVEPDDETVLENCDNLTVAPWGDLVVCEDGRKDQYMVGVTPKGRLYRIARNAMNTSEFAGATVSPDGSTLFVNIQRPGLTVAITGPLEKLSSAGTDSSGGR